MTGELLREMGGEASPPVIQRSVEISQSWFLNATNLGIFALVDWVL